MATPQYTCPMHPEIVRDQPGDCPICGMALEPMRVSTTATPNEELQDMTQRFWVSVLLTLPLMILSMGMHMPVLDDLLQKIPMGWVAWLQALLATPVVLWCGWPLLKRGWSSLVNRHLNMFSLIALGVLVAYVYSMLALIAPQMFPPAFRSMHGEVNLYFEAAAAIITFVLLGQVLELRGREETSSALRALLNLTPKQAAVIRDGVEEKVPVCHVKAGEVVRVRPGEAMPFDGEVIDGHSVVDESMVTGESIPVEKTLGSTVIGGTMNLTGSFLMRADHVGETTLLAELVRQVAAAQRTRAPIQRLVDQAASYFVPAVLIAALLTFIVWSWVGPAPAMANGLLAAISVLIIACPCALGLATPMSITVGMGRGAQAGILIKDAESLERFAKINVLVVDKTGTLTLGKPGVSAITAVAPYSEEQILFYAASLEQGSEHPLATAIISAAATRGVQLQQANEFVADVGRGIRGHIGGKSVALGNEALLSQLKINIDPWRAQVTQWRESGATVVFLVIEQQLAGFICISDALKPTTIAAISALHQQGVRIIMLTGDHRLSAAAIAKQLAIDAVEAEVLPTQKHAVVEALRAKGQLVAMAGDGINDAAALASADIGIAMGTGTDIAMQSANITLVKGDLMGIVRARELSRAVMRNIRENLFLAFAYNILCIPIAAGVLYPFTGVLLSPMVAAAAMSLSSVSVVINALRLRHVKLT